MAYEDGVFATFYDEAIQNMRRTKVEGVPVFDDTLLIKIQVPNTTDVTPRPVQDEDKRRFPKSWEAYETGKEPASDCFPLGRWAEMTPGEMRVCNANMIKTVEQLANVPDGNVHRLGQGGMAMKVRAVRFLKELSSTDEVRKENAELKKRLDRLEASASIPQPKKRQRKRLEVAN